MGHISRLVLENFTAFAHFDQEFSEGVNVLIGENGTGKTQVLKVLYSMRNLFGPHDLPNSPNGDNRPNISALFSNLNIKFLRRNFSNKTSMNTSAKTFWNGKSYEFFVERDGSLKSAENHIGQDFPAYLYSKRLCSFIPAKEILSHSAGFVALYAERAINFDSTYRDIINQVSFPQLRLIPEMHKKMMDRIEQIIGGDVIEEGGKFFIAASFGQLDFNLVAEGHRKLALLWLLLQNGSLAPGSVLFWDEPEANLNPKLMRVLVEILLELQRQGVQIFLATHHYNILKSIDVLKQQRDKIRYFSLYKDKRKDGVQVSVTDDYLRIEHNPIDEADDALYDSSIVHELEKQKS